QRLERLLRVESDIGLPVGGQVRVGDVLEQLQGRVDGVGQGAAMELQAHLDALLVGALGEVAQAPGDPFPVLRARLGRIDRKSTRLNSSHVSISYAVFCLKKKKNII